MMEMEMKLMGFLEPVEYQAMVRMPSAKFEDICRDLATIGDAVVISVTKDSVIFSTSGDTGKADVILRHYPVDKPEEATVIHMKEPVSLTYDLKGMNSFTKATPLAITVTLSLSAERPMAVEYNLDKGHLRFLLGSQPKDKLHDALIVLMSIPEAVGYQAIVQMPSAEFQDICRNLSSIGGGTVLISVTRESVKFSTSCDTVKAVVLRQHTTGNKPEEAAIIHTKVPVSLAFDLEGMNAITKATPLSNTVALSFSAERPMVVEYKIEKGHTRFLLGLQPKDKTQDLEMKLMGIPEAVEYQAIVSMPSVKFQNLCRNLASIGGDTVVISVTKESVKFSTSGGTGKAIVVVKNNAPVNKPREATIIQIKEPVSLTSDLRNMNSFTKTTPMSNTVTLSLSAERPIMVEYKIAKGYIRFYLDRK